jgi:hypothetical protein
MAVLVDHIADVSFTQVFLGRGGDAPAKGEIGVNDNVFDVSFENGRVSARFLSGNWFTNLFRGKTMRRFKENLQTQYDNWAKGMDNAKAAGFKVNTNVAAIRDTVDKCFDIICDARERLDVNQLNCSKELLMAYAMPHSNIELELYDITHLEHYTEVMPPNVARYAQRLGQIGELAAVRNELMSVATGTEAADILLTRFGFKTHHEDNCQGKSETEIKQYILNMLDAIINGFFEAVNGMKDKNTELFEFLDAFDGTCVEAKNDNVQTWLQNAAGISKVSRSDTTNDLAFCAAAEFNALADEVEAPFREEARKSCEAEIRAQCQKEDVTSEELIKGRIDTKVDLILQQKAEEIEPLVLEKIKTDGKFALYENLVGAKRPVTLISKDENGSWTVTTLVDKNKKPILKPVSAYDIDKNFDKLVEMYKEDAVLMGLVKYETREESGLEPGNRMDFHAKGVLDLANAAKKNDAKLKELADAVKAQMRVHPDVTDAELENAVREGLGDLTRSMSNSDDENRTKFDGFVNNVADGSYADQLSDADRLANLIARRVENILAPQEALLADIDNKAAHCAQMMKLVYRDKTVDVQKAQQAIATTLRTMNERIQSTGDSNNKSDKACRDNFNRIVTNGRLFTDKVVYDVSHRPAGSDEVNLHKDMDYLLACIKHYGKIDPKVFILDKAKEVA